MVQSVNKVFIGMSFNKEVWDKILTYMIPASFGGIIFLMTFVITSENTNVQQNKDLQDLKTRMRHVEETRLKKSDFENGIKYLETDVKYMSRDIQEIKELLKEQKAR